MSEQNTSAASAASARDAEAGMPEDSEGWLLWCREGECLHCQTEDDIREGVFRLMFSYQKGEEVLDQHREEARKVADELIADGVFHFEGDPSLNLLSLDALTAAQARIAKLEREIEARKVNFQQFRETMIRSDEKIKECRDQELQKAVAEERNRLTKIYRDCNYEKELAQSETRCVKEPNFGVEQGHVIMGLTEPAAPATAAGGEALHRQWSGGSYVWDALTDVEKQRWNRLASQRPTQPEGDGAKDGARLMQKLVDALDPQKDPPRNLPETIEKTKRHIAAMGETAKDGGGL